MTNSSVVFALGFLVGALCVAVVCARNDRGATEKIVMLATKKIVANATNDEVEAQCRRIFIFGFTQSSELSALGKASDA
ncbi:MAG: hypothetical protein ACRD4H_00675 [Candidatus Acidiferrales bacterium]